jgi:hypothetical protein
MADFMSAPGMSLVKSPRDWTSWLAAAADGVALLSIGCAIGAWKLLQTPARRRDSSHFRHVVQRSSY